MSNDAQAYIDSIFSNLRTRPVLWAATNRSHLITDDQCAKLEGLNGRRIETQQADRVGLIEEDVVSYVELLFGDKAGKKGVLASLKGKSDLLPPLLMVLSDALSSPKFVDALLVQVANPYTELVTFLEIDNEAIQLLTSRTLGVIISHALKPSAKHKQSEEKTLEAKRALGHLYAYHAKRLQDSTNDSTQQDLSVQSFVDLLRAKAGRRLFWANAEDELDPEENEVGQGILLVGRKKTIDPLVNILRKATTKSTQEVTSALDTRTPQNGTSSNLSQGDVGLQLLYHVLLVFWSLTFEEQVASKIEHEYQIIWTLLILMKSAIKEKIARLSIGILSNLLRLSPDVNLPPLSLANPLSMLAALQERYTADPDITEDLSFIVSTFEHFLATQTTLEKYAVEVTENKLTWSASHRNVNFWKKNANDIFDYKNGLLIKKLAEVLKVGSQATLQGRTLTKEELVPIHVACHDCAALLTECPERRKTLEDKEIKDMCLAMMSSADPELRFEALQVVQLFLKNAFAPRY